MIIGNEMNTFLL